MKRILLLSKHAKYSRWVSAAATLSITGHYYLVTQDDRSQHEHKDSIILRQLRQLRHLLQKMQSTATMTSMSAKNKYRDEYDFIILGYGNAGQAAVETLRRQCPSASIAIVDPFRSFKSFTSHATTNYVDLHVDSLPSSALGFHPPTQMVQLLIHNAPDTNDFTRSTSLRQLHYKHAILIATGVRGAPPPNDLVDPNAWSRLLELRPTILPYQYRPALAPHVTQKIVCQMAASQGAKIAILGSGWDAINMAVAVTLENSSAKPILSFGGPGPLSNVVPRYLSTSINKRLQQHGITVCDRTLVRYLSSSEDSLEIHTTRTFDLLDTKRYPADLVVMAPSVHGPRGTAVLPSLALPQHVDPSIQSSSSWYQSWSQLTAPPSSPSMCVCYADDGRVMVNAELHVASNVYAAGSVAKYPNSVTGHGHVAGEGTVDGTLAGHVAALHMARDYHEKRGRFRPHESTLSFAAESFPVWRSDKCCYGLQDRSSLSHIGVDALCVGICDPEKMVTHGFWWTNQAANTASLRERKLSRRLTKRKNTDTTPVYGVGAVFYFDRSGRVCGVMIWGLPFTGDLKENLNEELLQRMKDFITSNAKITNYEQDAQGQLMPRHLAEESKHLVKLALQGKTPTSYCLRRLHSVPINAMPKPLHQYTAAKPSIVQTMGRLRRDGQEKNSEVLGENLYVKDEDEALDGHIRPSSLVYVYPFRPRSSTSPDDWKNPFELTEQERIAEAWEDNYYRARPPKEEPIWLRPGEAGRITNQQNKMLDQFLSNMKKGVFADGSDPIGRPDNIPSPDFVIRTSERFRSWMKSEAATKSPEEQADISAEMNSTTEESSNNNGN